MPDIPRAPALRSRPDTAQPRDTAPEAAPRRAGRTPLPVRPPRLFASLSLAYLAELAGDEVGTVLQSWRGTLRVDGATTPLADAQRVPVLRPDLRWRHPLSSPPAGIRLVPLAAVLLGVLLALLLLAAVLLPMRDQGKEAAVEIAVLWQGPVVIGTEQAPLQDIPSPPPPAEPLTVPEAEAEPPLPEALPADEAVEPEANPGTTEEPPAETGEEGLRSEAETGPAGQDPVPMPRPRPAPLVADVVLPPPDRPLPDRPLDRPSPQAAVPAAPSVDNRPAAPRPAAAEGGLPQAPEGVQQIALRVFASDGPEPRQIEGFPLPVYPVRARLLSLEGVVVLRIDIGPQGGAGHVWLERSSGYPDLDEAAFAAMRTWRFDPPTYRGRAVRAELQIPVVFRLRRAAAE